jgi:hypothetical protein
MKRKLDSIQKKQKEESSQQYETLTEEDKRQVFENPTFLQHNKGNYIKLRVTSKTLQSAMDRERVHIDVRGTISKKFNNIYSLPPREARDEGFVFVRGAGRHGLI